MTSCVGMSNRLTRENQMSYREIMAVLLLAGASFVLAFGFAQVLTDLFDSLQRFDFGVL